MDIELPKGMTRIPEGWPKMADAYFSFVMYSMNSKDVRLVFREDTGLDIMTLVKVTAIEKLIDETSGYTDSILSKFLDWITIKYWGEAERKD